MEGKVTTNTREIQMISIDYYKWLYANKMDSLDEMEKFLKMYNVVRLKQGELENMNRPITNYELSQ